MILFIIVIFLGWVIFFFRKDYLIFKNVVLFILFRIEGVGGRYLVFCWVGNKIIIDILMFLDLNGKYSIVVY